MDGERLLERTDINLNMDGATPLQGLRLTCNLKPPKLPIDREDMDPNCADNRGQTPVYCAGRLGHEEMLMRALGGDDVELNLVDNECLTPLDGTLRYGYVGVVKTLLGFKGVDLNLGDGDGAHCFLSLLRPTMRMF